MQKLYIIGVESNRRVRLFAEEARRRNLEVEVVDWHRVLDGAIEWPDRPDIRIDSFGEDFELECRLIRAGRSALSLDPEDWDATPDHGRIRQLEAVYQGFETALETLPGAANHMSPADDLLAMFDKLETQRRLDALEVPMPRHLAEVRTWDEVRAAAGPNHRIFIKPRHSSSASGILAVRRRGARIAATTSVERVDGRLYNTLKVRELNSEKEIARIIELLGREDSLLVQRWVPKDSAQQNVYDLRFVVIDGRAEHAVMRVSGSPMTNLHLGNRRGDLDALRDELGPAWAMLRDTAVAAAGAFESLHAGVDIGLLTRRKAVRVFEVNAFGDLLPGVVDPRGRSTYRAEVDAWRARTGDPESSDL